MHDNLNLVLERVHCQVLHEESLHIRFYWQCWNCCGY